MYRTDQAISLDVVLYVITDLGRQALANAKGGRAVIGGAATVVNEATKLYLFCGLGYCED